MKRRLCISPCEVVALSSARSHFAHRSFVIGPIEPFIWQLITRTFACAAPEITHSFTTEHQSRTERVVSAEIVNECARPSCARERCGEHLCPTLISVGRLCKLVGMP